MAVAEQLVTSFLKNIKKQLPETITEKDIITTFNLTYMHCNNRNELSEAITNISTYYKKKNQIFDDKIFINNFHNVSQCINKDTLEFLRVLMFSIWMYKLFDHPLLFNDFIKFVKNFDISNTKFLKNKIIAMIEEIIDISKKIESCQCLNNLNKLTEQINNSIDILQYFKLVCENYKSSTVAIYNFIATRLTSFFIESNTNNNITLLESEVKEIKEIIKKNNNFKKILVVTNVGSECLYQLDIKLLSFFLKEAMLQLLDQYELKIDQLKENKSRIIRFEIKCIVEVKIKNIFNLSKIIFDVLKKPVKLLPLTELTSNFFNKNNTKISLDKLLIEIIKKIDDSIGIVENLKIKIIEKEKILNNDVGKEVLLSVPIIKTSNKKKKKKDIKKSKVAIRPTNEENEKTKEELEITKPELATANQEIEKEKILNNDVGKEVLLSVPVIKTSNKKKDIKKPKPDLKSLTFDPQNINNTEQVITKNDKKIIVTKEYKEDKLLIRKVNELENKLKKSHDKQQELVQQLMTERQKVQLLTDETKLLTLKVTDLEIEKMKLVNIKNQNSIKINNIGKNLQELQKNLKNIHHNESKKIKKLKDKKSNLVLEKKRLETENENNNSQLKKLNEQLVKTQQTLKTMESENHQLFCEVNNLKQEKIKLENVQQQNNSQIKIKAESISLLEDQLTVINNKLDTNAEIRKLIKQKSILNLEKKRLEEENKINKQQLTILTNQLIEKENVLSQCNPALNLFIKSYDVVLCTKVEDIYQQRVKPGLVWVDERLSTGNQFLFETNILESTHVDQKTTPGFCLQPKLY